MNISLLIEKNVSKPEAFKIRNTGKHSIEIIGTDAKGVMYAGLEVAELLKLGLPIKDREQKPFVEKRGVKINIPFDTRTLFDFSNIRIPGTIKLRDTFNSYNSTMEMDGKLF